MKAKLLIFAVVAATVAGCAAAPESRIMAACTRDNANTREACTCFVDNLKQNLTPEQLNVVAAALEGGEEEQQRMQEQLGMQGAMSVAGAAKSCGMSG